jgi:hypothetical protein
MSTALDEDTDLDLTVLDDLEPREPCQSKRHDGSAPEADWCTRCKGCGRIQLLCDPCFNRFRDTFARLLNRSKGTGLIEALFGVPAIGCPKCGRIALKLEDLVEWWPRR